MDKEILEKGDIRMSKYQEALDKLYEGYENGMAGRHYYDIIERELKALEIIKKKNVLIMAIKECKYLKVYNLNLEEDRRLTQEEFNLLKEVFIDG